jgi:hypothetical protein
MTWPIVCDDAPGQQRDTECPYCHKQTPHPCGSMNAKWCNNYAPNAIEAFKLQLQNIERSKKQA